MKHYKLQTEKLMRLFISLLICSLFIIQLKGCTSMTETQKEREERIQSSPQSQNGKFVNPNGVSSKLFSQESWEYIKDLIFRYFL